LKCTDCDLGLNELTNLAALVDNADDVLYDGLDT
jgi:hypothetical protein